MLFSNGVAYFWSKNIPEIIVKKIVIKISGKLFIITDKVVSKVKNM